MRIALDYDGTYTADPDLWDKFISLCQDKHDVWIVTMRYTHEPIDGDMPTIYTGRKAKKAYCSDKGIDFDIWIDDNPEWLFQDSK